MTTHERRRLLCEMLGNVNAEWRELARDNGVQAKWTRMKELRSQRLAITAELFDLDVRDRVGRDHEARDVEGGVEGEVRVADARGAVGHDPTHEIGRAHV